MYLEFFNLKKFPFENNFDEIFFFESETHTEAYSRLEYVIENRKSCATIFGAYGCGKTFVLKMLIRRLSKKGYIFSEVVNPAVDDTGILKMISYNFLSYKLPQTKADILILLEKFLKDSSRDSKHCVVLVDEAQNIPDEKVFEELRMLLNYSLNNRPLLTLILSGQNDLQEKMLSNKQFIQRVYLSYEIKPLSFEEVRDYIKHRLSLAGGKEGLFSEDAISAVYEKSGGIPRWINSISDMSLLTAFTKGISAIDRDIVEEAYLSIRGDV